MNLNEIQELWAKDCIIAEDNLANESLKIPKLHHKYMNILVQEHLSLEKSKTDYMRLYKIKYEYYTGSLDFETLKERKWEPFQMKILKNEVDKYLEADSDLIDLTLKIAFKREKVEYLESIIKTIANRSYHINNAIDFLRFSNGG